NAAPAAEANRARERSRRCIRSTPCLGGRVLLLVQSPKISQPNCGIVRRTADEPAAFFSKTTPNVEHLDLAPIRRVSGTVRLPGSKSISNRILLLAALAHGTTRILDVLDSDDTRYMLEALRKLGIAVAASNDGAQVEVHGAGGAPLAKNADLFLGN